MSEGAIRTKRWSAGQYERAIDRGVFHEDERIELLDGRLVVKEPPSDPHATAIDLVAGALRSAFGPGWLVRTQAHFAPGRMSRPEPDVYVVPGTPRDYASRAPRRPALVVEVSQSRLAFDRTQKARIYARSGVRDYWIVNLVESVVEVRRDPVRVEAPSPGWSYRSAERVAPPAFIAPLARPDARIAVSDLLP